jgi:5-methylthioribose kinase
MENLLQDNENNKFPIGQLFDSINYYTIEDFDKFVSNLNNEQSLYCLIQAVQHSFSKNIFSLEESEVISKSIRTLSLPIIEPQSDNLEENN